MPGRVLAALPPLAVVTAGQGACPLSPAAFEDVSRAEPGQQVLLDLMLITALCTWFTRPDAPVPIWYRAHSDPVVGSTLRLPNPPIRGRSKHWQTRRACPGRP